MKRSLVIWIVLLALGLQGSMAASAAVASSMQADCQTSAEITDTSHKPCCPSGSHTVSCCLDVCVAVIAIPMTAPSSMVRYDRTSLRPQWRTPSFSSRGDSPLIRPPIL